MSTDILGRESFVTHRQGRQAEQTQTAAEKSAKAGARLLWKTSWSVSASWWWSSLGSQKLT